MSHSKRSSLEDRIADAFLPGVQSQNVSLLMQEVEAAALSVGETADRAKERALDPTLSSVDVATARAEMNDAAFNRDRMNVALTRLGERHRELVAQEEQDRRWKIYKKTSTARDALAAEFKELYPGVEARVADLLTRIVANDREIARINRESKPDGAPDIAGAELVARGLDMYRVSGSRVPRITEELCLPAFEYRPLGEYAWP